MMAGTEFCREMRAGEEPAVAALLRAAFGGEDEVRLVEALRADGDIAGEMVLPREDGIAGYYALSKLRKPVGWLCLAPVAIRPDLQRQGHGRRMLGLLAEWARLSGTCVVVLGEPGFYTRCGFDPVRAQHLRSPYPVSHTLLAGPGGGRPDATLVYPAAFGAA